MTRKKKRKPLGPKVDIIVAVYGGLNFIKSLVKSLDKFDAGEDYNLVVVDDCTPGNRGRGALYQYYQELQTRPRTKIYKSSQNRGFAGINNWGSRKCSAPLILFLNSDIEVVEDGWLKHMVELFENWQVGVVGAKLVFPDDTEDDPKRPAGTIQHAGVVINILGQPYHICLGWPEDDPRVNFQREHQIVTGACLMIRRKVFRQVGGFNEIYKVGNFEDCEMCLLVNQLGHKVVYQPKTKLIHYHGGSGNVEMARRNEQIFKFRMAEYMRYDDHEFCLPWKGEDFQYA